MGWNILSHSASDSYNRLHPTHTVLHFSTPYVIRTHFQMGGILKFPKNQNMNRHSPVLVHMYNIAIASINIPFLITFIHIKFNASIVSHLGGVYAYTYEVSRQIKF